jgi:hypothetical protein
MLIHIVLSVIVWALGWIAVVQYWHIRWVKRTFANQRVVNNNLARMAQNAAQPFELSRLADWSDDRTKTQVMSPRNSIPVDFRYSGW